MLQSDYPSRALLSSPNPLIGQRQRSTWSVLGEQENIAKDQHDKLSHRHTRAATRTIRLTVQLDLLPNNSGLHIIVSIPLDLDRIALDSPSVNSTNELLSLIS
jgi:hypothetical protein